MIAALHPVIPLVAAAVLTALIGIPGRRCLAVVAPAASLWLVVALPEGTRQTLDVIGHECVILRVDALSRLMAVAFSLYALIAGVYAWSETGRMARGWSLLLAAGGVGVTLAGDLLTLFLFWELLSMASTFLIWDGGTRQSVRAGFRYAMFHSAGGLCLLGGILILMQQGPMSIDQMSLDTPAAWLILIGVLTNAAVPPLHAWLADAYPEASICGTVFLAAFTTKSAVYVLARLFPGVELLVWLGAAMALYGVIFAVLENDIRRLLCYHIVSQVGYMVCGVGLATELALDGVAAHAFCHIFYKGLLLMSAGAVIHATGRSRLTELGGLAWPLKWTLVLMMIGAFSISGVPLFNGFVSKSMVISAAVESHRGAIEMMLLVASMGTFLHTGLKLPWFTFAGSGAGAEARRPVPWSMYLAMLLTAVVCVLTGVPGGYQYLYSSLPIPVIGTAAVDHAGHAAGSAGDLVAAGAQSLHYAVYSADHVVGSLQLLVGTALGFWVLRKELAGKPTVTLDVDRLYRTPSWVLVRTIGAMLEAVGRSVVRGRQILFRTVWIIASRGRQVVPHPEAIACQVSLILLAVAAVTGLVVWLNP